MVKTVAFRNFVTAKKSGMATLHLLSGYWCCFPKKKQRNNKSTACLLQCMASTGQFGLLPMLKKDKKL